jgi:hypothetical protein
VIKACRHCETAPRTVRVEPAAAGAVAVTLRVCDCDYPRCHREGCSVSLRHEGASPHLCLGSA